MFKRSYINIPPEHRPEIDELPGELALIAEAVEEELPGLGVEVALILGQKFSGTDMRMHNCRAIVRAYLAEVMRAEYDGGGVTVKELARKYGVSMTVAKEILSSVAESKQRELQEKQGWLF